MRLEWFNDVLLSLQPQYPLRSNMDNPFDEKNKKEDEMIVEEVKEVKLDTTITKKSKKQQILDQYGGLESNVPINSNYWKLKF